MKKELEIKEGCYYFVKKGYSLSQPECVVKVDITPNDSLYVSGIKISNGIAVYIEIERFAKEITRETDPEYYL